MLQGRKFLVRVPELAIPGETQLRVDSGSDQILIVTVPSQATPGDSLVFTGDGAGHWRVDLKRTHPQEQTHATSVECNSRSDNAGKQSGHERSLCRTRLRVDPNKMYSRLVDLASSAGAYVNPKIMRGEAPPLMVPGLLACDQILAEEVLIEMPCCLHLSASSLEKAMPAIAGAVHSLPRIAAGCREDSAQAACLACLFAIVANCAKAGRRPGDLETTSFPHIPELWYSYAEFLLSLDFEFHPYWKSMVGTDFCNQLEPSKEPEYVSNAVSNICANYDCIIDGIAKVFEPCFDLGLFLHAHLCLLSREWMTSYGLTLVPVLDLFNHSHNPGARQYWYANDEKLVIRALRPHAAGEEILISYEVLSNPVLLRQYGFTLPPEVEPDWTCCVCETEQVLALCNSARQGQHHNVMRFEKMAKHLIDFPHLELTASRVSMSLAAALDVFVAALETSFNSENESATDSRCAADVAAARQLRDFLASRQQLYECDWSLSDPISYLRNARKVNCKDAAWWALVGRDAGGMVLTELSFDEENARRVKMSEYLCLLVHVEALSAVVDGTSDESLLSGSSGLFAGLLARWRKQN